MASVPYNPVPQQTLQDIPTPEFRPNIPRDAFGGNVAEATQSLGKTIDGVGNEIFSAALKMQDLANRAEVDKADAEFMKQAGLLHADFSATKGLNAKEALPKYMSDLEATRKSIRDGIKSDAAKKMYDSTSLGTYGRTVFNGAGHAGSEVSQAARTAANERIQTLTAAGANTADERTVTATKRTLTGLLYQQAKDLGLPSETAADRSKIINSSVDSNHIQFLAKNNQLEDAAKKFADLGPSMTKEDYERTQNTIRTQQHSQGSARIVDNLITANMNPDGTLKISVDELQKQAKDAAKKEAPNDAVYPNVVVRTLDAQLNQQKYAKRSATQDNRQVIAAAIQGGASSLDQLLKDPKASAAYYQLDPTEQNKVPLQIYGYIRARDKQHNEESMTELKGLKNNDTEAFLNLDPSDPNLNLSQANQRQMMDWQQQIKKQGANQDPRVDRAMGWMRQANGATMSVLVNGNPNGPLRRTDRNAPDFDRLTGAVQSALDLWIERTGKPPSNKEFNESIAPEILKTHTEPGFFGMTFGGNKYSTFKPNTSAKEYTDFSTNLKSDLKSRGAEEPTEIEIEKAYTRTQLMKLFPAKKATP